jgi:hypothetical protein
MSTKSAKITKCVYVADWINPSGGTTYYHELTLDNGDVGRFGTNEKYPKKISEGSVINYIVDEKGKYKLALQQNMNNTSNNGSGKKSNNKTSHESFLGYAWSYSKDLIIAGKTMDDVEELNKVARYIYDEIGKMLNNN